MPNVIRTLLASALVIAVAADAMAQTPPARPATPAAPKASAPTPANPKTETPPSLDRVNGYFNAIKGMQADFVQIAPDGRRFPGILYLLRPGRMRFEYAAPAALEVVADGTSVAIRDRKLKTQDTYFIGQTPLKFLLQPKIDVAKDSKVIDLKRSGPDVLLYLEDKSTLGGTSKIRVMFDGETYALKEWLVTDPQGNDTRVMVSNINLAALPDKGLFVIENQKVFEPKN